MIDRGTCQRTVILSGLWSFDLGICVLTCMETRNMENDEHEELFEQVDSVMIFMIL